MKSRRVDVASSEVVRVAGSLELKPVSESGGFRLYLVKENGVVLGFLRKGRNTRTDTLPWQAFSASFRPGGPIVGELLDSFYDEDGGQKAAVARLRKGSVASESEHQFFTEDELRRKGEKALSSVDFSDNEGQGQRRASSMNHEKIAEKVASKAVEGMGLAWFDVGEMSRTEIVVSLTRGLGLGRGAKLLDEQLMVMQEGSSNKFHYFALFEDMDNERFVAGNAYGRIGYRPTAVLIAEGSMRNPVEGAFYNKAKAKLRKGYMPANVRELR